MRSLLSVRHPLPQGQSTSQMRRDPVDQGRLVSAEVICSLGSVHAERGQWLPVETHNVAECMPIWDHRHAVSKLTVIDQWKLRKIRQPHRPVESQRFRAAAHVRVESCIVFQIRRYVLRWAVETECPAKFQRTWVNRQQHAARVGKQPAQFGKDLVQHLFAIIDLLDEVDDLQQPPVAASHLLHSVAPPREMFVPRQDHSGRISRRKAN